MTAFTFDEGALYELKHDPNGPVGRDLERRAIDAEAMAKRLLSLHGSGRVYRKTNPTRIHQASAPGEPPAKDTGLLVAAMGHNVDVDEQGLFSEFGVVHVEARTLEERAGDDANLAEIAIWLEHGTRHMEARPFLRPSLAAAGGDSEI